MDVTASGKLKSATHTGLSSYTREVSEEVETGASGSHGMQPLRREGNRKGTWTRRGLEAEETCRSKARTAGAEHF